MTLDDELAKHVGHRAVLVDLRHLRCIDCTRTVLLPSPTPAVAVTRYPPRPGQDGTCDQHPTEWAGGCRWCRADHLETPQEQIDELRRRREQARVDPRQLPEWQQVRDQLAARTTTPPAPSPTTPEDPR